MNRLASKETLEKLGEIENTFAHDVARLLAEKEPNSERIRHTVDNIFAGGDLVALIESELERRGIDAGIE